MCGVPHAAEPQGRGLNPVTYSQRGREGHRRLTPALVMGLLALGHALLPPSPVSAQGVRGWVGTTAQMVEMRPMGLDTIHRSQVTFDENGRGTVLGQPVDCSLGEICTRYQTLPEVRATVGMLDLSLTAWGLGMQGLSITTLLRARTDLGGDFAWPRANDDFDAMLVYAQLARGPVRVRVGRQEVRSGLGFSAFDGGSLALTVRDVRLEGYGGRSMARGLREPANEALRGIEAFLPDQSVYLYGAAARARVNGTSLTGRYHREILADGKGLASERASVDFSTVVPRARINGSLDYDWGFRKIGKGHLTVSFPFSEARWLLEATARRYMPYFDLSTIWGFFEPVAYSELEARLGWSPEGTFAAWLTGGRRQYEDANTTEVVDLLTDDGWRADAGLQWRMHDRWQLEGSYRLEWGPGAFLSSGDLGARYSPSDRLSVTASGMTFQQIAEFRVGEGRAVGGGLSFDLGVTDRARLAGGFSVLRHRNEGEVEESPWNQSRAWAGLRIEVGNDPGLTARRQP